MSLEVVLSDHSKDPISALYIAYRTANSKIGPIRLREQIAAEKITPERMLDFVQRRLAVGHTSPLEHVWFQFNITGVSRVLLAQLTRHHSGISYEVASQRAISYSSPLPVVIPGRIADRLLTDTPVHRAWTMAIQSTDVAYHNAMETTLTVTVNLTELLHIADLRLCTQSQREFRLLVAAMRREVMQRWPLLGKQLAPKCALHRLGNCDEDYKDWEACPIGRVRPHKTQVFAELAAELGEEEFKQLEDYRDPRERT